MSISSSIAVAMALSFVAHGTFGIRFYSRRLPEVQPGPRKPAHDGSRRHTQYRRRLTVAQILDAHQEHDFALLFRQAFDFRAHLREGQACLDGRIAVHARHITLPIYLNLSSATDGAARVIAPEIAQD